MNKSLILASLVAAVALAACTAGAGRVAALIRELKSLPTPERESDWLGAEAEPQ